MDLKTLVVILQKIEVLDKQILIYLHLILNNLDKRSSELNFYQNKINDQIDNLELNINLNGKSHKENQSNSFNYNQNELIFSLLKALQKFICMKYFNIFKISKSKLDVSNNNINKNYNNQINNCNSNNIFFNQNENSQSLISDSPTKFYENCVTLILVISVKFSKINKIFSSAIVENFIGHLEVHSDCLIYFIFFYRCYLFCANIKIISKEYELFNYLFSFYKKFYKKSIYYELGEKENKLLKKLNFDNNINNNFNQKEELIINSENKRFLNYPENTNIKDNNNNQVKKNNFINDNKNNSLLINKSIFQNKINNINKFINPEENADIDNCHIDLKLLINNKKYIYTRKIDDGNDILNKEKINEINNINNCINLNNLILSTNDRRDPNINIASTKNSENRKKRNSLRIKNFNEDNLNNLYKNRKNKSNSRRFFVDNFLQENKNKNDQLKIKRESSKKKKYHANIDETKNNYLQSETELVNNNININDKEPLFKENNNSGKKFLNNIPRLNFNNKEFLNKKNENNKIQNISNRSSIKQNNLSMNNSKIIDIINIDTYNIEKNKFKKENLKINELDINSNNHYQNSKLKNISTSPQMRSFSSTNKKRFTTYHAFKNSIINQNPLNSNSDRKTAQHSSVDFILNSNSKNYKNISKYQINKSNETNSLNHKTNNKNIIVRESLSIKKKIPELKFPLNTYEQHYSLSRSSHRNDFIKSSGSSTTAGYQTNNLRKKMQLLNIPKKKEYLETESSINFASGYRKLANDRLNNYHFDIITPLKKLKKLGQTLGESCLAADLASLINHKRDMELEKIAKDKNRTMTNKNILNSSINHINKVKKNIIENNSNDKHNCENENKIIINNLEKRNYSNLNNNKEQKTSNKIFNSNTNNIEIKTDESGFNITSNFFKVDNISLNNIKNAYMKKNKIFNNNIIKEEEFFKDLDSIKTDNDKKTNSKSNLNQKEFYKTHENLIKDIGFIHENSLLSQEIKRKKEFNYIDKLKNSKEIDSEEEYYYNLDNKNNFFPEKNLQIRNILNKQQRFKNSLRDDKDINNFPSNGNIINKSHNNVNELSDLKKNFIFSFENTNGNLNFQENNEYIDKNLYKMRELLINLLLVCIKEYTLEEIYTSKINVNLLYSFLLLPSLQTMRKKLETKVFFFLQ